MQQHEGLTDLFVDTLKDIYSAEKQILRSLPKLARAAQSETLREAFLTHRDQTEDQIGRLDDVLELIGERPGPKTCEAMQGILEEGDETIADYSGSEALDAGLIAAGQAVEHYEISRYTALRDWAQALGLGRAVSLLSETLNEERETDRLLTEIAEDSVNGDAKGGEAATVSSRAARPIPGSESPNPKTSTRAGKPVAGKAAGQSSSNPKTGGAVRAKTGGAGTSGRATGPSGANAATTTSAKVGTSGGAAAIRSTPAPANAGNRSSAAPATTANNAARTAAGAGGSGSAQSGGAQKSPGAMGGRTLGDDEIPPGTRTTR